MRQLERLAELLEETGAETAGELLRLCHEVDAEMTAPRDPDRFSLSRAQVRAYKRVVECGGLHPDACIGALRIRLAELANMGLLKIEGGYYTPAF